jgi:hypothetical protein
MWAWGNNDYRQCQIPMPNRAFTVPAAGNLHSLGLRGGSCDPCDINCDGAVNAFDIEPFIELLISLEPEPCTTCAGDLNGDGVINAIDIEPFIACLAP